MWSDWLVFCDYGFSVSALWCPLTTPTVLLGFLLPWTWSVSSWLLQQSTAAARYLGGGVSPQGCPSWSWMWSSSSQPSSNTEKAEVERFYEDLQDLLELVPQKRCPFHYRGLECKSTGYSEYPLPTTQEKTLYMDITRWSTSKSDWLYSLQPKMEKQSKDGEVSKNKTGSWLWLRSWIPYCQIQT